MSLAINKLIHHLTMHCYNLELKPIYKADNELLNNYLGQLISINKE